MKLVLVNLLWKKFIVGELINLFMKMFFGVLYIFFGVLICWIFLFFIMIRCEVIVIVFV